MLHATIPGGFPATFSYEHGGNSEPYATTLCASPMEIKHQIDSSRYSWFKGSIQLQSQECKE